jgi:hypothetical protein
MNIMFILVVGFGVLFLGLVIATAIFNAKVSGSSQPAPWMGRVRRLQNERENAGWRIRMIPYNDTSKPMTISLSGVAAFVPVAGALGFLVGLAMATYDQGEHKQAGLIVAGLSFLTMLAGVWLKARYERQGWDVASARCVDRELQKILVPAGAGRAGSSWVWVWRIVCEFEYLGIPYRVTPAVHWAGFGSEGAAISFLEARIAPSGECMLRVNPANPLQTELLDSGSKEEAP